MKKYIYHTLFFLCFLFFGGIFIACINDDDYSVPDFVIEEPDITVNYSIAQVLERIETLPTKIESDEPLYLEAYVVSSDEAGNFHKNLVIQDKPENPTAGINISTDATDMYLFFEPGRKVYVRVDGLYVGDFRGLPSLGENGEEIGRISVEEFDARVLRSNTSKILKPNPIEINQISSSHLNTLIRLENVEFLAEYAGLTYANPNNNFGVDRIIQDCNRYSIVMRNSGYADFRTQLMPIGNGKLIAILSIFNGTYQLMIRDTKDVSFTGERCSQEEEPIRNGMPFKEDFSDHLAGIGSYVNLTGWTNSNLNGGIARFEVREFSRNNFAQISAFGTGEDPFEVWLITPNITLDKPKPILVFDTKDAYHNGNALSVLVSTNFTGNPNNATWVDVTHLANIPSGHTEWENNFTSSG